MRMNIKSSFLQKNIPKVSASCIITLFSVQPCSNTFFAWQFSTGKVTSFHEVFPSFLFLQAPSSLSTGKKDDLYRDFFLYSWMKLFNFSFWNKDNFLESVRARKSFFALLQLLYYILHYFMFTFISSWSAGMNSNGLRLGGLEKFNLGGFWIRIFWIPIG